MTGRAGLALPKEPPAFSYLPHATAKVCERNVQVALWDLHMRSEGEWPRKIACLSNANLAADSKRISLLPCHFGRALANHL
jgi:hypothetical protein